MEMEEGKSKSSTKEETGETQPPSNRPEEGGRKELGVERTTPIPGSLLSGHCYLGKGESGFFWKCAMSN